MLLSLWNYLRGYVVIYVTGFSVERFVNLVAHKGIYIWDLCYYENGVEMKVSIKAFKHLKTCAKKTKCKIKIVNKRGIKFVAYRYRKRKILLYGVVFFIGFLYFLSSFVWLLDISGNDRISYDEIHTFLNEKGLKVGALKHKISTKDLENELKEKFPDISWVNVYLTGTKASVNMTEIIPKRVEVDKGSPADVVASKDGLIVRVATSAGRPTVKEKDVVRKGDLLISSKLISLNDMGEEVNEYVHAEGEVWAKMYYEVNFKVPFEYVEKEYTGQIKKTYGIIFLEKSINFFQNRATFLNYDRIVSRYQVNLGENYPLPIIINTYEYREFNPVNKERTLEESVILAEKIVTERIINEFDFETDIVDKEIKYIPEEKGIQVISKITTNERIDETVELITREEDEVGE